MPEQFDTTKEYTIDDFNKLSLKDAAIWYAAHGIKIFPCHPKGTVNKDGESLCKRPLGSLVPHGVKDATNDVGTITKWWTISPHANIGLACGAENGVTAVDLDRHDPLKDGVAKFKELATEHGLPTPEAAVQKTGGGGYQLFFKYDPNVKQGAAQLYDGIDVRNDGGYVVVAPSVHDSGNRYQWKQHILDKYQMLPEVPEWLVVKKSALGKPKPKFEMTETIPYGQTNTVLTSIAGKLRNMGMTVEETQDTIRILNSSRCDTPLSDSELESTIFKSIANWPPDHDLMTGCIVGTPTTTVDIPEDPNPPFPEDCMYGWCGEKAKTLGTPLGYSYPAMLAVGAVMTPPVPNIRSNLNVANLGPIGTGKSMSIERAISTIDWEPSVVNWCVPGSDRGLYKMFKHDESYPKAVLLAQDELRNLIKSKVGIQGAALPYVLCELWNKDSAGGVTKDSNDAVALRLSILGAMKCDDAVEFQSLFGQSTTDGLNRRFIFGVAPSGWEWQPVDIKPEPMRSFYSVQLPQYCYELLQQWRKAKQGRSSLGEIAMRVALVTSFMNYDAEITKEAMNCAFRFMEWQEQVREIYKPGEAETKEAEVEAAILTVLNKLAVGEAVNWWKIYRNKHLDRKGSLLVNRVRDALVKEGMIGFDPKTKAIWRKE
jgi:hypothetical protein